ncbi:MAG: hypothetical protein PHU44_09010 [Syntrophales bacterium]|nr:hypothetical protein [Syntrophales bacterium]MDD5642043.1 hypothetical protein [Syntrophales bacterium]
MKKNLIPALMFTCFMFMQGASWAATEFSLGGFIKLVSFWDSTQTTNHMNAPIQRNNNPNFHHGRLVFTAQESRFNFTIKGPKLWGAAISGFLEMDFDCRQVLPPSASNSFNPQLRHAMFRLNWPGTELLVGQYWSMFSEWFPEVAENGPFQGTGTVISRMPQVRLSQTFLSDWTVAALVGNPNPASLPAIATNPYGASDNGEAAESPQIQGKIRYQRDWWGKAPYYGKPLPFTAQITAGWQRNVIRQQALALRTFGQNAFVNFNGFVNQRYLNPWLVMGTAFIPVIPTRTANMAGTASILTQWWIGQGVEAFGAAGLASNIYRFDSNISGNNFFEVELQKRWGGFVQAKYYFTNQWFLNLAYGISKAFGISQDQNPLAPGSRETALSADQQKIWQQVDLTLWYRPIMPLKFCLQYSFARTDWLQKIGDAGGQHPSDFGTQHRVQFAGIFFF